MTKKEAFVKIVQKEIFEKDYIKEAYEEEYDSALSFFNDLKKDNVRFMIPVTESGLKVLTFLYENKDKYNNTFVTNDIGEGLSISGHAVSGCVRKLITEGLVSKVGKGPTTYSLTEKGINYMSDNL